MGHEEQVWGNLELAPAQGDGGLFEKVRGFVLELNKRCENDTR